MKEYIITCRNYEDLKSLYDDLETPGGSHYIPNRSVELIHRRSISRNTHYRLTEDEAIQIREDDRVIACELLPHERGIVEEEVWEQTGNFNKIDSYNDGAFSSNSKNWGLWTVNRGDTVSGWGSDGSQTEITNQNIKTTASGRNVDVVIVDSHINPDHPEFAVNVDGTGGSRVNQINWFSYSSALGYSTNANYDYSTGTSSHGTHVAGTTAGNTQGWARDANIFNMTFSSTDSGVSSWSTKLWDYLRYFHKNKSINPSTGRRNPTITNHSWGSSYTSTLLSNTTSVTYRGTTTDLSSMTSTQKRNALISNGCPVVSFSSMYRVPARNASVDADIQDAINDGVIVISAAGNSYWNCDIPSGVDYNNYIVYSGSDRYHSRGSSPSAADNVICVGSISSKVSEYKSNFSNWGKRVEIWAPGTDIISGVKNTSVPSHYTPIVADPRNSNYYLASISGTSMASPQVCGVIACLAEQEENLTQAEALQHLIENSKANINSYNNSPNSSPYWGFPASSNNNRYVFMPKKRSDTGMASPAVLHKNRNTSTQKYPRVRYNRVYSTS